MKENVSARPFKGTLRLVPPLLVEDDAHRLTAHPKHTKNFFVYRDYLYLLGCALSGFNLEI